MDAHEAGTDFRVIVVDSRPKMEGEELYDSLVWLPGLLQGPVFPFVSA